MIRSITCVNPRGEELKLDLFNPFASGLAVTKIDGLGPAEANINTTDISTNDGSIYNSARLDPRYIDISLRFVGTVSPEETRLTIYRFFPIKKKISLIIETDSRLCKCDGYIEKNDVDIFSRTSGTKISIVCPDPYFYSLKSEDNIVTKFFGSEPVFEFPFSNESLTDNLIEFTVLNTISTGSVYYKGDADIGVIITITAYGECGDIVISNTNTQEQMVFSNEKLKTLTGQSIKAKDQIIISTIRGDKSVKLIRDGIITNVLNCIGRDADWFQLSRGDNPFVYSTDHGIKNLQFEMQSSTVYEGI